MKAKEARKISVDFLEEHGNIAMAIVLRKIKREAMNGRTQLVLDDPQLILSEEDYERLEKLGYKVERHRVELIHDSTCILHKGPKQMYHYGIIGW